jgi:hypothetical protein
MRRARRWGGSARGTAAEPALRACARAPAQEKLRLEAKQRQARAARKEAGQEYRSRWFNQVRLWGAVGGC